MTRADSISVSLSQTCDFCGSSITRYVNYCIEFNCQIPYPAVTRVFDKCDGCNLVVRDLGEVRQLPVGRFLHEPIRDRHPQLPCV